MLKEVSHVHPELSPEIFTHVWPLMYEKVTVKVNHTVYRSEPCLLRKHLQKEISVFVLFCLHKSVSDGRCWYFTPVFFPQILMEAVRGRSYTGDIAIDDIRFSNANPCTLTPAAARVTTPAPPSTTTSAPATVPSMFVFLVLLIVHLSQGPSSLQGKSRGWGGGVFSGRYHPQPAVAGASLQDVLRCLVLQVVGTQELGA